jgi:hypothetical protein
VRAFEADALTVREVARFFQVGEADVHTLFSLTGGVSISKAHLWDVIATGCDDRFATLMHATTRLERLAKLRAKKLPPSLRRLIRTRDQDICRYCGQPQVIIHIDHVIPQSKGGSDDPGNLVVSCGPCNGRKSDRLPHEAGMIVLPAGMRLDSPPTFPSVVKAPRATYRTIVMRRIPSP